METEKELARASMGRSRSPYIASQSFLTQLKKTLFHEETKKRFEMMLGEYAPSFMQSILSATTNNKLLMKADPTSIIRSSLVAAYTNLSIDTNLGQAALVPYGGVAQFQIMKNGYVQLAHRTGNVARINVANVYEGDIEAINPFTGDMRFNLNNPDRSILNGFVSYLKLMTGADFYLYMTVDECKAHGAKYSKSFYRENGLWQTDFVAMGQKTVLKSIIKKWCPINPQQQPKITAALKFDQSVPSSEDIESCDPIYVDGVEAKEAEKKEVDEIVAKITNE